MKRKPLHHAARRPLLLIPALILLATGCKTIVRENILSSIDTGVGATVSENRETQLYELKAGYIRSQFYSIPTGKRVEGSPESNAANVTPEVVSGIKEHSGLGDLLLGMDVSENFAVGQAAVNSPAAVAMYISTATSATNAQAAAVALSTLAKTVPVAPPVEMAPLAKAYAQFSNDSTKKAEFDAAAQKAGYPDFRHFLMASPAPTQQQIQTVQNDLEKDSAIKAALEQQNNTAPSQTNN